MLRLSVYTKIGIKQIEALLIGSAILDLWMEQNNKSIRMFPSLNPYYYKIKKAENGRTIDLSP
jgi:hypothetical protein